MIKKIHFGVDEDALQALIDELEEKKILDSGALYNPDNYKDFKFRFTETLLDPEYPIAYIVASYN